MRYRFFFQPARVSTKKNKREWYILYCWQLYDGKRKSASHWELLHQGGRWSKIEGGDTVNKGDIVCNADDKPGGREAFICLRHQQLKTITCTLFLWPPSPSLYTSFFSFSFNSQCLFFLLQSWKIGLDISLSPSSYPCLGAFLDTFLLFLYKVQESQTLTCHQILCLHTPPFTHMKDTYFPRLTPPSTCWEMKTHLLSQRLIILALTFG